MKQFFSILAVAGIAIGVAVCIVKAQDNTTTVFNGSTAITNNQVQYQTGVLPTHMPGPGVYAEIGTPGASTNGAVMNGVSTNVVYFQGGTNYYGMPGTSSNLILNVSQFDDIGFQLSFTGSLWATNAAVGVQVYQSDDGGFEWFGPVATIQNNETALQSWEPSGYYSYSIGTNFSANGATTLAFVPFDNCQSIGWVTNFCWEVNMKAQTYNVIKQGYGTGAAN
ncbi:MAG TPA: hypothetical protein VGJ73_21230 [Verrucomicrobiae bacterium]|jgi:hypothetical protein